MQALNIKNLQNQSPLSLSLAKTIISLNEQKFHGKVVMTHSGMFKFFSTTLNAVGTINCDMM